MNIFDYLNEIEIKQLVDILNSNIELIEEFSVNNLVSSYKNDYSLYEEEYCDYLQLGYELVEIEIQEFYVKDSEILIKYKYNNLSPEYKRRKGCSDRELSWSYCSEQTYGRIKEYLSSLDSQIVGVKQFNLESLIRTITRRVIDQTLKDY